MAQKLNPTRMNLIMLKGRQRTARKGYDVLKKKREVLVLEFLRLLKQSGKDRDYLYAVLQEAYKTLAISSTYVGNFELEEAAIHVKEVPPIGVSVKNIMGVRVPEIKKEEKSDSPAIDPVSISVAAEDINTSFSEVLDTIMDVAQREQGLKKIVVEVEKTKRRVNALDYVVIPEIKNQAKYISIRLQEIDRDMFSALKHVKKKLSEST